MKILFLYTELAGYVVSCFKALAAMPLSESSSPVELHIVRFPVNSEAPFEFNFPDNVVVYERNNYDDNQLLELAKGINPDKIICSGWVDKGYMKVCRAFKGKVPTIMSMDNQWHGTLRQQVMRVLAPFVLHRTFSHAWVPGEPQKRYALKLGFKEIDINIGFYSADTSLFSPLATAKQQVVPHRLLYVGRYIAVKGMDLLFDAFIELQKEHPNDWELWCVGTGELYDSRPAHPAIRHLGFQQPEALAGIIAECGVFVLPSRFEPWGVVVHEMAAAGMPMVVSSAVGAASRFLTDGANGFLFESGSKESLKSSLLKIMQLSDAELKAMGQESHRTGMSHTPGKWAETVVGRW